MIELFAGYFATGFLWLSLGCLWARKLPETAFDWGVSVMFIFLWPLWLGTLIKEWLE